MTKRFELLPTERPAFEADFSLLCKSVELSELTRKEVSESIPDTSGCYIWLMEIESRLHKIYLGRTRSIRRRLSEYAAGFQIHSPNDYKLHFFQKYIQSSFPDAKLDLYFCDVSVEYCKSRETELIRFYRPLINERLTANSNEKDVVMKAFGKYYQSIFERKWRDGA